MKIRVITFDLDNTLWDVGPALHRAEAAQNAWLKAHRPGTLDAINADDLNALRKRVWSEHAHLTHNMTAMRKLFLQALQSQAGYSEADADAGATTAFDVFLAERQRVEVYPGVVPMLASLARDFRLGALTNGNADVYKTEAGPHFDFAFLAEDVGASKPAADMFHAALAETGASPEEVVHVGDSPDHDIRGAQAVGMRTVWINPGREAWEGEDHPDAETHTVLELPQILSRLGA